MEINNRIKSDFETLNEYNQKYSWIPNENQIRPTEMIITFKNIMMEKIKKDYNSTRDYILINMFNCESFRNNGKILSKEPLEIFNHFEVCRFRYQIDPKAFHYIMWYTCSKEELNDKKITNDIKNSIYAFIKTEEFSFIWYENPKMTIEDIYHVQVFWIKL